MIKLKLLYFYIAIILPSIIYADDTGIIYSKMIVNGTTLHILNIDPRKFDFKIGYSDNKCSDLNHIANKYQAIAGINGGFFRYTNNNCIPAGILKDKNIWHGIAYQTRGAISWNNANKTTAIDRIRTISSIILKDAYYPINNFNSPAARNYSGLYSSVYGNYTISNNNKIFNIINDKIIPLSLSNNAEILEVKVPQNGYIYKPSSNIAKQLNKIQNPTDIEIKIKIVPELDKKSADRWRTAEYVIGAGPVLIHDGKKILNFISEKLSNDFLHHKTARSAIGILKNGSWLFLVAEHNWLSAHHGLTIPELANLMLQLGAYNAINLDGGGSSQLYFDNTTLYSSLISSNISNAILAIKKPY